MLCTSLPRMAYANRTDEFRTFVLQFVPLLLAVAVMRCFISLHSTVERQYITYSTLKCNRSREGVKKWWRKKWRTCRKKSWISTYHLFQLHLWWFFVFHFRCSLNNWTVFRQKGNEYLRDLQTGGFSDWLLNLFSSIMWSFFLCSFWGRGL